VEIEETAIVHHAEVNSRSRLGSHGLAALFVILLAAFGVFCGYYPWKIPTPAAPQKVILTSTAVPPVEPRVNVTGRSREQKSGSLKGSEQALPSLSRARKSSGRS